tara:strand:- start:100 stop:429 length:330 start_codon:yes stop_codon:yes gene_type:complete
MPTVSGYISIDVDVSDFDREIGVEFFDLADVISAAEDNNYTLEEIVDWCFENGLNISDYLMNTLSHQQFTTIYKRCVTNYMDELELKISNQEDTISELKKKLKDLEDLS